MFLLMTTYSKRLFWMDRVQECDCVQMCIDPWGHINVLSLQLIWFLYCHSATAALDIPSRATLKHYYLRQYEFVRSCDLLGKST